MPRRRPSPSQVACSAYCFSVSLSVLCRLVSLHSLTLQNPGVQKHIFSFERFLKLHKNLCVCVPANLWCLSELCVLPFFRPSLSSLVICTDPGPNQPPPAPLLSFSRLNPAGSQLNTVGLQHGLTHMLEAFEDASHLNSQPN